MSGLTLHRYQEKGIDFVCRTMTAFEAIDMGLGKTIITLKAIERLGIPTLVLAPLGPMYNTWPAEIKKWGIKTSYDILHGPNKFNILTTSNADIWLMNYHGIKWFMNNIQVLKGKWKKRMLVLDESSMIKSHSTVRFKSLKKMMPLWHDYRLCLSATPAPNGYHELWPQYYMLDKGKRLMTSYHRFRGTYFNYIGPPVFKTSIRPGCDKQIEEIIKPITYRLDAKDYIKMPDLIQNEIPLALPSKLRREYEKLEKDFLLEFKHHTVTALSAGTLSNKLRQFIQGALYIDDSPGSYYPLHTLKVDALKQLLETSVGKPILCPIQFKFERKMINIIFKKEVPCIAGGTPAKLAQHYINEWNKGNIPLLLCHPASLSHGVNLQSGGHLILWYGLPWSIEQYQQLNGRIHRQGQKSPSVIVHHLVIKDTIDEVILKVLRQKDARQQNLLDALRRLL